MATPEDDRALDEIAEDSETWAEFAGRGLEAGLLVTSEDAVQAPEAN